MKALKYEYQSIKVGGWWGGWWVHGVGGCRVHGVGGCGGVGVVWVVVGFMGWVGGWWCGWWWGGCWRIHGVGAYTHPPMNSYNV